MMTLTENPIELTPAALRFAALFGLSTGFTPSGLRARSAGTPQEAADKRIADEIDLLAECGFTRQVASAVLDERNRANRALHAGHDCAEEARQEIRAVAGAFLNWKGPAAVGICRQIADAADKRGDGEMRRSFTEFADAADQLLAERGAESFRLTP
jgi:hypothetical protein